MKFLDYNGLSVFWNRVKAYIDNSSPSAALAGTVSALAAADRVNLLPGTNRGKEGWTASYSSDGEFYIDSAGGGKAVRANFLADTASPGWQMLYRGIPAGLLAEGEEYVLSFSAFCGTTSGEPMVIAVSVGDAASTRELASSDWIYVSNIAEGRYEARLRGKLAGKVTGEGDLLKIAVVYGQNRGWKQLAIWDMKLERGTVATGYTPAPEDATEALRAEVASLQKALLAVSEHLNGKGLSVCVLADIDSIDLLNPDDVDYGALVLDEDKCHVYQSLNNPTTRQREFVVSEKWTDQAEDFCRDDVLYYCKGRFYWWEGSEARLVPDPAFAYYPSVHSGLASAQTITEEAESGDQGA